MNGYPKAIWDEVGPVDIQVEPWRGSILVQVAQPETSYRPRYIFCDEFYVDEKNGGLWVEAHTGEDPGYACCFEHALEKIAYAAQARWESYSTKTDYWSFIRTNQAEPQ